MKNGLRVDITNNLRIVSRARQLGWQSMTRERNGSFSFRGPVPLTVSWHKRDTPFFTVGEQSTYYHEVALQWLEAAYQQSRKGGIQ
jgi:hypothetical protein